VALALAGSPALALGAARAREANDMARVVESAQKLQADGDAALKRHNWPEEQFHGPGALAGANPRAHRAVTGTGRALDPWGRERNASEQAVDLAHMSVAEARQAQLELVNNLDKVYIQLALHFAQRDIVKAELEQQEQILALAKRRLAGGIGTHFEVSQAEAP